jgi:hypothetical protein
MDPRIPLIEILETASAEGLPQELRSGENVPDVMIYHDLIDQGYLMGTILSDGRRPYFIEGCHITSKGREYLVQLRQALRRERQSAPWRFMGTWIGFFIGLLLGACATSWWVHHHGLPSWLGSFLGQP